MGTYILVEENDCSKDKCHFKVRYLYRTRKRIYMPIQESEFFFAIYISNDMPRLKKAENAPQTG